MATAVVVIVISGLSCLEAHEKASFLWRLFLLFQMFRLRFGEEDG